jgi:hypothetical protein
MTDPCGTPPRTGDVTTPRTLSRIALGSPGAHERVIPPPVGAADVRIRDVRASPNRPDASRVRQVPGSTGYCDHDSLVRLQTQRAAHCPGPPLGIGAQQYLAPPQRLGQVDVVLRTS